MSSGSVSQGHEKSPLVGRGLEHGFQLHELHEVGLQLLEHGLQLPEHGLQLPELGLQLLELGLQRRELGLQLLELGLQLEEVDLQLHELGLQLRELGLQLFEPAIPPTFLDHGGVGRESYDVSLSPGYVSLSGSGLLGREGLEV